MIRQRTQEELTRILLRSQATIEKVKRGSRNLIILDKAFPNLLSAFRIAEFNYYLAHVPETEVHCLGKIPFDSRPFRHVVGEYGRMFPHFVHRVRRYNPYRRINSKVAYTLFISQAYKFLEVLERDRVPFLFTLYPGGGFRLNGDSDRMLRRVFSSPCFKSVIVTQKVTLDYLISRHLCSEDEIQFVWGGVVPTRSRVDVVSGKGAFGKNKDSLDICFVAWKYMQGGLDKGYDVFVEVARRLSKGYRNIQFHVVGPYVPQDIDVTGANIWFHGPKKTPDLEEFYSNMDIILSPNRPFVLAPGAFDGFPTGACVEAGLSGVVAMCTDPFGENEFFTEQELVIISPDPNEICERIKEFYDNPIFLHEFSKRGAEAFSRIYNIDTQMSQRLVLLGRYLL